MKKFILIVCGSFVGAWLAFMFVILSTIVMSFAMMGLGASKFGAKPVSVGKHSVLVVNLDGDINERSGTAMPTLMDLANGQMSLKGESLNTLMAAIDNAAGNDKIEGIVLMCEGVSAAPATLQTLRSALKKFRTETGKFVYAYAGQGYAQGDYYVASVADSIFVNPVGVVDLHGMASAIPYMKGLYDKLGVEMQVLRVGTFKSAVEPYILNEMSDANREQTEAYLGNIWQSIADSIALDRHLTNERINQLADTLTMALPSYELINNGLVDAACYEHEFEDRLRQLTGLDKDDDLRVVFPSDLAGDVEAEAGNHQIAVVYATGTIDGAMGGNTNVNIDSEELCDQILDLAKDDKVAGMVLRVNSPGGAAYGAEQVWEAIEQFKKTGKPVAASMGDYAASGGYYISSGAHRIFAEPTTITGSIGIFGIIPNGKRLAEDKLGVHLQTVKTNENSDMGANMMGISFNPLTPAQTQALQNYINNGYEIFVGRCAMGRKKTVDEIKEIAEGRVWDGKKALEIGLVDEMGTLADAIKWVAKKANIDEDRIKTQNYPTLESPWSGMMGNYLTMRTQRQLREEAGPFYTYYEQLREILNRNHVLCLMEPIEIQW